jgi:hypothetical protein
MHDVVEVIGRKGSFAIVKATITVKNTSSLRVCIVGSTFNMQGYSITPLSNPVVPKERAAFIQSGAGGDFVELPQWIEPSSSKIVNSGRLFPPNDWWLDAGDEQSLEFVTYVPDRFDLVSLRSDLRLSKSINEASGRCYSDKILVQWIVDQNGLVDMKLTVKKGRGMEPYDFRKHRDMLGESSAPYHILSSAWVPTSL